jgi:hypothetical protein
MTISRLMAFLLILVISGCAFKSGTYETATDPCPPLPQISDNERMKDYTVRIIDLYKQCAKSKVVRDVPH